MAGTLFHSREFRRVPYIGSDDRRHFETEPIDGDADTVSVSTYRDAVLYLEGLGVPEDVWPAGEELGIDVDLDEARRDSDTLRSYLSKISIPVDAPELVNRIVRYLENGETIVFCT